VENVNDSNENQKQSYKYNRMNDRTFLYTYEQREDVSFFESSVTEIRGDVVGASDQIRVDVALSCKCIRNCRLVSVLADGLEQKRRDGNLRDVQRRPWTTEDVRTIGLGLRRESPRSTSLCIV